MLGLVFSNLLVFIILFLKLSSFLLSLQQFIYGFTSYCGSGVMDAKRVVITAPLGNVWAIIDSLKSYAGSSIFTKQGWRN